LGIRWQFTYCGSSSFYKTALAAEGKSKESPQARLEYYPGYYATWVLDRDGHDIEVVNKS